MFQIESQAGVRINWVNIVVFGEIDIGWELENLQQSPFIIYFSLWDIFLA